MNSKAGAVENQITKHIAEMDEDNAKKRKLAGALDAVLARVSEIKTSTVKLNSKLGKLIDASIPKNEEEAYRIAKTAVALGQLLDVSILDKNGTII